MKLKGILSTGILCLLCAVYVHATVIYVDKANQSGIQNGQTWATAFSNLQTGIDTAAVGDSVWVAMGTYQPQIYNSFSMKDSVKIFGGFQNTFTSFSQRDINTYITTLKGNQASVITTYANIGAAALLDGFTITEGYSTRGAGMYNSYSSPSVSNCRFYANRAEQQSLLMGGGMYNEYASPVITNCDFIENTSVSNGAGMYNIYSSPKVTGCRFSTNHGTNRAGEGMANHYSTLDISNCTFINNEVLNYSCTAVMTDCSFLNGTITALNNASSNVTIEGCSFLNNSSGSGGAMTNSNSTGTISNCLFYGNSTTPDGVNSGGPGGAMVNFQSSPVITHCTFDSNFCYMINETMFYNYYGGGGGAIYNTASTPEITDCTFSRNYAESGASGNAAFKNGGGAIYSDTLSVAVISHCNFSDNKVYSLFDSIPTVGGGAIYNANRATTITHCTFTGNTSSHASGGAIYNGFTPAANPTGGISNCIFYNNESTASLGGGGIFNNGIGSGYKMVNCHFRGNIAGAGGGMYNYNCSPAIINTLFSQTQASLGGGIFNRNAAPKLTGCTFGGNQGGSALHNVEASAPQVTNSIIWGNGSGIFNDAGSSATLRYSLVQDIPANSTAHLLDGSIDPLFTDTSGAGNYRLLYSSPCINMGQNDSIPTGISSDLAGKDRVWGTATDLGAYEYRFEVDLGNDTLFCDGNTVLLDAGNNTSTFLWNDGSTAQTLPVNASGDYTVTVTNTFGSASDTIHVEVVPFPVVHLGNDTVICAGTQLTLNAGNTGAIYLWNTGDTTQTTTVQQSGMYSVQVTAAGTCTASDSILVTADPLPVVNLGPDLILAIGASINLDAGNAGASYLWNTGATGQTISVTTTGDYSVTVTNTSNCSSADTVHVIFGSGIGLILGPNPSNEVVYITITDTTLLNTEMVLTNAFGKTIRKVMLTSTTQALSMTGLNKGIYLLKLANGNTIKLVKG